MSVFPTAQSAENPAVFSASKVLLFTLFLLLVLAFSLQAQRFEMVWNDEFDTDGELSNARWTYDLGNGCNIGLCGWGNSELQTYTNEPENVFIEDGNLHIIARRNGSGYTSARIKTQFRGDFLYGRFEIRARLPVGQGLWPAIWMLPTDNFYGGWPNSGEIDIMEYRGNEPDRVEGTVHYRRPNCTGNALQCRGFNGGTYLLPSGNFSQNFHDFAIEWDQKGIRWFVDGNQYHEISRETLPAGPYPFDRRFHMIINLAVGGNFLPNPDPNDSITFPATMLIEHVRVYQDVNEPPSVAISGSGSGEELTLDQGEPLSVDISASDSDGTIDHVIIRIDDVPVDTLLSAPFTFTRSTIADGCYTITAEAVDNDGGRTISDPLSVIAGTGCNTSPFGGIPHPVPGIIRFADYDLGGNRLSYLDNHPLMNRGQAEGTTYRVFEGVDTRTLQDGGTIVPVVAFTERDEWLQYTVDVAEAGLYDLVVEVAPQQRLGGFRVEVDGQVLARFLRFDLPGDDNLFSQRMSAQPFHLDAGQHTIRVTMETDGIQLHTMDFRESGTSAGAEELIPALPSQLSLDQNFPNPFNPNTTIGFNLPDAGSVNLTVFDLNGRIVRVLVSDVLPAGEHRALLEAGDLASGIYVYTLRFGSTTLSRTMLFVK